MTATQLQIRRDTAANIALSTPVSGEIWYDTTNKRLNVGDGSNVGGIEVPNYIDVQNGSFDYALATGTANAIAITTAPSNPTAYATGQRVRVKIATTNTGSATINWGGLGVKTIRKWSSGSLIDLTGSELISGMTVTLDYDGTYFVISGGQSSSAVRLISSVSISGSPQTVDFANIFVANKNYEIVLSNIVPSGNAHVYFLFGSSGTSWLTSSYSSYAVEGTNTNNSTSSSQIELTATQIDSGGASGFSGVINVISPMMATGYKKINGLLTHRQVSTSQTVASYFSGDYVGDAASKASFRIDFSGTETFLSGLISVYEKDAT